MIAENTAAATVALPAAVPAEPSVPAPDLVGALYGGIRAEPDDWGDAELHVSDLGVTIPGEGCPRQLKLRLEGAEKRPLTVGEALMFDHGHRIHERATELLRAGLADGWTIDAVELPVAMPNGIRGTLDVLLRHESGATRVLDYKTVRGRAFNYLDGPKPANALQVRAYTYAVDAEAGDLLYIDREGQNGALAFEVERDDAAVEAGLRTLVQIRDSAEMPPVLTPVLERRQNKGPDSLVVKQPWCCDYCPFQGVSCDGALPPEKRDRGIVAKITDNNELLVQPNGQDMALLVEELLLDQGVRV
jgi:hypothetical protein